MSDESSEKHLTRREILTGTLGIAGAVWLAACDGGGGGTDGGGGGADGGGGGADAGGGGTDAGGADAGPQECNSIGYEMTNRHPMGLDHTIEVPLSDVMAGVDVTYDITGDSRHPHTVLVTAAHFAMIAAGMRVTITSSEDMGVDLHDHDVTLFCQA